MNKDFNLKSPAAFALNKRLSWSFETFKPGIDFSSLAMKVLDGNFFQYKIVLSTLKMCCLVHYSLSYIFWITWCSFYIINCCFTLYFYVVELASFFKPHQSTSVNIRLFFYSFLTSHRLCGTGEKALLWIRPWLKAMLWLVWSSLQNTKTFSTSAIRLFHLPFLCSLE